MHRLGFAAFAATAFLFLVSSAGGMLGGTAQAMTLSPPAALGVAAQADSLVHKARAVCGTNGCVAVQVAPPRKHKRRRLPPGLATKHRL